MKVFRVGELFCGPGGLGMGLHWATGNSGLGRFVPAWANDIDPNACATYKRNIMQRWNPEGKVFCGPVQDLFANDGVNKLPKIDGLAFGFPCNDYSIVGEQKGLDGDFGPLYRYGVEVLKHHQPEWFIAENVSGLQSANNGKAFEQIKAELANPGGEHGYVITPHLYKFEEYGVPQSRHRLIIVGIRSDLDKQGVKYAIPQPTHGPELQPYVSVRQALENPPIGSDVANHELTQHTSKVVEMLRYIKPGENAWTADIPDYLRLNVKNAWLSQIYRRLKPDEPAYTLTGSGGGGTHMYHWSEHRALTNRERARIQTFPDDFVFTGTKGAVRKQIGMAVPPAGAMIIGSAILQAYQEAAKSKTVIQLHASRMNADASSDIDEGCRIAIQGRG